MTDLDDFLAANGWRDRQSGDPVPDAKAIADERKARLKMAKAEAAQRRFDDLKSSFDSLSPTARAANRDEIASIRGGV